MPSLNVAEIVEVPKSVDQSVEEEIKPEVPKIENPEYEAPKTEAPQPKNSSAKKNPKWEIRGLVDAFKDAESPPWVIEDLVMSGTITLVLDAASRRCSKSCCRWHRSC